MKSKQSKIIIDDEYYNPAPFAYGEDFKKGDIDVSKVSSLLLATGVVQFLLSGTDQQKKEEVCKQLKISVDGFVTDRLCIYVEDQIGLMPLTDYLKKKEIKLNHPFYLSEYFSYVSLNTAEAFEFDPSECYKKVISYYNGIPGWPDHEYIKKEYMNFPSWEQNDLCHTFIDYFTTHRIEPDIQKKQRAYDWLMSNRKYKRLLVLGEVFPTTPNSVMVYDKSMRSREYQRKYDTPEKVEKKLNTLLEGMIKLVESATLLMGHEPYFGDYDLEALKDVYNRCEGHKYAAYNPIFEKLSFGETQLDHVIFLEECRRLADFHFYSDTFPEPDTIYDHFSGMVSKVFEQIRDITDQALKRW